MTESEEYQWYHIDIKKRKIIKGKGKENESIYINMKKLKEDPGYKQAMINRFKSKFLASKGQVIKMPAYISKKREEYRNEKVIIFGRCPLNTDRRNREPVDKVMIIGKETIALPIRQETTDFSSINRRITIKDLLK